MKTLDDELVARIAKKLGWTSGDVRSLSLQSLRDILRVRDFKLSHELTIAISKSKQPTKG